ncbi:MAG: protein-disulfide reductase DsbD family protein [Syntrophobacteraceae bacterium]
MRRYGLALPGFFVCFLLLPQDLWAAQAPAGVGLGMFWSIFWVFMGGMALNLTPCVYPLIPITISYFSSKSTDLKAGRGSTCINALLYVLGIALMNSMLGVFAALSGRLMGTLLENPVTLVLVALVMCLFALSMFGVWEIRLPASLTNAAARNYAGYFGSLVMGLTLGIVAAPCIGPFVAGILVMVANTRDPVFGFWIFFSLSLGMGFPLFILALLSGRLAVLPKSGEWMLWVRKGMGWVMIGAAAYFVAPIMPDALGVGLLCAIALAAGIHLGWIDSTGGRSVAFKWIKKGVGVACIGIACVLIWNALPSEGVKWTPFSEGALAEAKASGRPVVVDFYADWCSPCRRLDKLAFHDRSVIGAAKDFVMIRVDFTKSGDHAKESLAHQYGVSGVPTVIFLKPGGEERVDLRVMDILEPDQFLARMNELKNSNVSASGQ